MFSGWREHGRFCTHTKRIFQCWLIVNCKHDLKARNIYDKLKDTFNPCSQRTDYAVELIVGGVEELQRLKELSQQVSYVKIRGLIRRKLNLAKGLFRILYKIGVG